MKQMKQMKQMKRIVCFGEAIIDFLNTGATQEGALSLNNFTQFAGGAPANAAVAVAKLGGKSAFAGQVGDDSFGHFLLEALQTYGVDTALTAIHPSAKTPLAFILLDDEGERSFSFHHDHTADVLLEKNQVSEEWFSDAPIFHFCSNTLTDPNIAEVTQHLVSMASTLSDEGNKTLISFDVNLRHNLWPAGKADVALVNRLVDQSHLVKFASEEIDYLCGGQRNSYLSDCFSAGVKTALVTDGGKTAWLYTEDGCYPIEPPKVKAIDTTGGGDGFIGAVLFGLSHQADPISFLCETDQLKPLIEFATHCGAYTVSRRGAFPALPTFDDIKHHWKL